MNNVQVLDCTLRDGGYLVDKNFGETNITEIIDGLVKANIDIIEIGFLQNEGFGDGKTVFKNEQDAKQYVPSNHSKAIFTGFADCSRYDIDQLGDVDQDSFTAVRQCFYKWEKDKAFENCKKIINKGYKCFVQPVDIMGYSDKELIDLIDLMNALDIYCFSIVDTFGSMYDEDLVHIFSIIDRNLRKDARIGFHSHNNLQMSSALSQKFIALAEGKRHVIVDGTLAGMGRGAGNTPTELVVQYLIDKYQYMYDMNCILDVLDHNIRNLRCRAQWGYNTEFFLAGVYGAHVNNVAYLLKKNSIKARDIRFILNKLDYKKRKRYDYDLLEKIYLDYLKSQIDDKEAVKLLKNLFRGEKILVLAAGKTINTEKNKILDYIEKNKPIIVSINRTYDDFNSDFVYISNRLKYDKFAQTKCDVKKIITSNIKEISEDPNEIIISLQRVIKCGWNNMDNSAVLLLRLLGMLQVKEIAIAGLDGYSIGENYADKSLELYLDNENVKMINSELGEMLNDFISTKSRNIKFFFLTSSKLERLIKNNIEG